MCIRYIKRHETNIIERCINNYYDAIIMIPINMMCNYRIQSIMQENKI